ncbi:hypothetical protein AK88_04173 [Plasmodium fragile]|uniref:Early transcribed membrane protein n=1 Tax=Plasmodium fragile TaxID=5857 RepID=A0A0D9QHE1_PLAFR|nr:uncharacterized protein AK88_04173 [Plasmodium fragile]KJP86202.1 hypothetical protein AK88_04173 [Plasmodium fragile]
MKIIKLVALFAILPIVCLLGKEEVDVTPLNVELQKEDLDVTSRIKKLLQKRKLLMMSIIAATVLAAGGILGGVSYDIMKRRKRDSMEQEEEPFVDIFESEDIMNETTPFKNKSTTVPHDVSANIPEVSGEASPANFAMDGIDRDTGENLGKSFFHKLDKTSV